MNSLDLVSKRGLTTKFTKSSLECTKNQKKIILGRSIGATMQKRKKSWKNALKIGFFFTIWVSEFWASIFGRSNGPNISGFRIIRISGLQHWLDVYLRRIWKWKIFKHAKCQKRECIFFRSDCRHMVAMCIRHHRRRRTLKNQSWCFHCLKCIYVIYLPL